MPFVSLLLKGTQNGSLTDIDGKFQLVVNDMNAVLQVSYLGYENKTVAVNTFPNPQNIIIRLRPAGITLNEISVIAGENPAHRIIRKASRNRDRNNPEKMHSFTYDSYNKFFVTADLKANIDSVNTNDTSASNLAKFFKKQHLFLMESATRREFLHPGRNHETIIASRVSGFKNSPFAFMATQMQSFSFYDDFVTVLDHKYLNPLSEGSTKKYFFQLQDTLYDGPDTVFVISFHPRKNKNFDALKGVLYINTNGYAIQNVIAEPDMQDAYSLSIKVQQKYEFKDGKQWFPVQLNTDWIWKDAVVTSKKDTTQHAHMKAVSRSYIKDIVLNPELKKKQFSEVEVEIDRHADKAADSIWIKYRNDTLTARETTTYKKIDSIGKAQNLDRKILILEALLSNKIPVRFIDLNIDRILRFNDYEGTRLGLGAHTNQRFSKRFVAGGYFGYGFVDKAWKFGGDASIILWKKKELMLNALYENDLIESAGQSFFENIKTLASSEVFRDLYISKYDKIEKYQASVSFRTLKYLKLNILANHQQRHGPTGLTIPQNDGSIKAQDIFNFNEAGIQLKYLYKEKFIQTLRNKISLGSDYPVIYANIIKGINRFFFSLPGDFDYWRLDLKIEALKTFKTIGTTRIQLQAGKVTGNVPYTLLYNNKGSFKGANINVSALNSFETMRMNEFASDQYSALFINHNIGRFLKLRKRFNPEFELVHSMAVGSLSNASRFAGTAQNNISVTSIDQGFFESGFRLLHLYKSSFSTFGAGVFYRYGAYQRPKAEDNLAIKLVLSIQF